MKKISFLFLFIFCFSCSDNSDLPKDLQDSQAQEERIEQLLTDLKPTLIAKKQSYKETEKVLIPYYSFELVKNERNGQIFMANFKEDAIFPIDSEIASKSDDKDDYVVSCSDGTSTTCSGAVGCGKAIKGCLDKGECAEICKAPPRTMGRDNPYDNFVRDVNSIPGNPNLDVLDILPGDVFSSTSVSFF